MRIKVEASGWPDDCKTELEKQEYCRLWHEIGVEIDINAVQNSPIDRAFAKVSYSFF